MTNGVNNEVNEEIIEDDPVVDAPAELEVPLYGDLYLKFPDEATAFEALEGYEGSVDIIGVIYNVDNKIGRASCRERVLLLV